MSTSETRDAAYIESQPRHPTQCERVLECIRGAGSAGLTRKDIEGTTGFPVNIVTGRVNDLLRRGSVVKSGERAGAHGVNVEVLVAQEFAGHPITKQIASHKATATDSQLNLF